MALSVAHFTATAEVPLTIEPATSTKALAAATAVLTQLDLAHWGGHIELSSTIRAGAGMGSSTADVVATIRAVTNAFGHTPTRSFVAWATVTAETASDPLMTGPDAVLFAHRQGFTLEHFAAQFPPAVIVGVDTAPNNTVATNEHPPARYGRSSIAHFDDLRRRLRIAISNSDLNVIGQVATASANINQHYLPTRRFDDLRSICSDHRDQGAVGVQVAHSGTVAGIIVDPSHPTRNANTIRATLTAEGFAPTATFNFGGC